VTFWKLGLGTRNKKLDFDSAVDSTIF